MTWYWRSTFWFSFSYYFANI